MRFLRLVTVTLTIVVGACAFEDRAAHDSAAGSVNGSRVSTLADDYVRAVFAAFPEYATLEGIAGADNAGLTDNSLAAIERWHAIEDSLLTQVRQIDTTSLAGSDRITFGFLREQLESSVGNRVCRSELWNVSPTYTGWQSVFALLASVQPVGSADARADALARARLVPRYLDTEIINLREGLRLRYTAPKSNVRGVIEQADALVAIQPAASPFYGPATRDSTPEFGRELSTIIRNEIRPAIRRYRDFLSTEYLPGAREAIGVSANPDGSACYRAAVRGYTSLELSAEQIHQTGLEQMARIQGEAATIAARSFPGVDPTKLMRTLAEDPQYRFRGRQDVIGAAQSAVDRAEKAVPQWFGIVPKSKVVIQPYAPFQEKAAPGGQYNSASDDGSRPGTYLINTYQADRQTRAGGLESTAFHETYPGHHLQIAIAKERPGAHPITRYFSSGAFVEGWGLYSERLADEMGLFSGDIDRVGLLSNEALRAARLVVDAGMHQLGWTRQRAIDYLIANTGEERSGAVAEIDRYIAVPGQATSYMIGNLEIRRLREMAQRELGPKFDVKAFHDRVLEDGGVTLAMLRAKIERWVGESR